MIPEVLKSGGFLQLLAVSMTVMIVGGLGLTVVLLPFALAAPSSTIGADTPLERAGWAFGVLFLMALPVQLMFAVFGSFLWVFGRRFLPFFKRR
jgi:hypothetical protein